MARNQLSTRVHIHPQLSDTIMLYGEYSDFRIHSSADGMIKLNGQDTGIKMDITQVVDSRTNETHYFKEIKNLYYHNDIGLISAHRQEPLPARVVIDVNKESDTHHINVEDLLKNQLDFNNGKFTILGICDAKGGKAELLGDKVVFTVDKNYNGLMSFRFIFENEHGYSAAEKVPVLLRTPDLPRDKNFWQQWYLEDINVMPVWQQYTGKGIKIAVFDSGFLPHHSDIDDSITSREQQVYRSEKMDLSQHALNVASVISAQRNDDFYIGIAYDAKISSYQAFGVSSPQLTSLEFFLEYDVINNSWGPASPFSTPNNEIKHYDQGFNKAAAHGRNGLGSIIIFASGNEGAAGIDSNSLGLNSSPYIIVVGGINKPKNLLFMEKQASHFSTDGENILVSAPASNIGLLSASDFSISEEVKSNDSSVITQGTSFSAPMVSGVVALMLQANSKLGYRDVQEILAASSAEEQEGLLPQFNWITNKATTWNGGGYHFSKQYGFGKIDASAAVKLAESWPLEQTKQNLKTISGSYQVISRNVTKVTLYEIEIPQNITIEHVVQDFEILIRGNIQDTNLYLQSPQGTISPLMHKLLHNPIDGNKIPNPITTQGGMQMTWDFGATRFRGETSAGKWIVKVETSDEKTNIVVNSLNIKIYGKAVSTLKQMIYTDELGSTIKAAQDWLKTIEELPPEQKIGYEKAIKEHIEARQHIIPEQKIDIINAAALSSAINVDLVAGQLNISNSIINIDENVTFKSIIGTNYNDNFIISSNQNMTLVLMQGHDALIFNGTDNFIAVKKCIGSLTVTYLSSSYDELIDFDQSTCRASEFGEFASLFLGNNTIHLEHCH